jgi:DeoR/GlpR family transcriptional regulator of sugar metabolism
MTSYERRQRLLMLLRKEPGLRVPAIAAHLGVSQGTVRNDLNALAEEKMLIRVHGGAAAVTENLPLRTSAFTARAVINQAAKQRIAREAAKWIRDGDAILLDASTSVYHMASFLSSHRDLRVVTNGLQVARLLSQNPTNTVILVGGILRADTEAVTGPWSERFLTDICTKMAFVSCSGFTPESGMTEVNVYEAQFRLKAIEAARSVIALIDSSKFGSMDLAPSIRPDQISHLITDAALASEWVLRLREAGIAYTLCNE